MKRHVLAELELDGLRVTDLPARGQSGRKASVFRHVDEGVVHGGIPVEVERAAFRRDRVEAGTAEGAEIGRDPENPFRVRFRRRHATGAADARSGGHS